MGDVDVVEGRDGQFECKVSGGETVDSFVWTFDGSLVSENNGIFTITKAMKSDSGKGVTCKAKKDSKESNAASATFTVLSKFKKRKICIMFYTFLQFTVKRRYFCCSSKIIYYFWFPLKKCVILIAAILFFILPSMLCYLHT